jgi:hypothetical protein
MDPTEMLSERAVEDREEIKERIGDARAGIVILGMEPGAEDGEVVSARFIVSDECESPTEALATMLAVQARASRVVDEGNKIAAMVEQFPGMSLPDDVAEAIGAREEDDADDPDGRGFE